MYTLVLCLLIACILPYVAKIPLAFAMQKKGGYDNHYPRDQQAKLDGFGARALAAHLNSFESLAVFGPAIATALATQHFSMMVQYLAMGHIILRVIYYGCYWFDYALFRSSIWFLGLLCSLGILISCLS